VGPLAPSASSKASRAARAPKRRYGSETPRVWTPPLRELTDETSLGFAAIEFATEVCGIDLYPWQSWLLIHALELDPALTVSTMSERGKLDPLFRFRKIVVLVSRQNGKSTLSQVLSLFFLYILGTDLVLGTAQDLDTAEEVWEGALEIIEETPELAALADKPIRNNGKKAIRLHTGERYKVKAANRRAGRGLSAELILLDELREHQSWDAWGAITKTTMARPAAQIWALSNAGDATSIVLRYLRKAAHLAVGDPDGINAEDDLSSLLPAAEDVHDMVSPADDLPGDLDVEDFEEDGSTLGLFEWSAPHGCPVGDIDGILQANPSTGHGISLRTLLGDAKADPEWVFRTECLCQWSEGSLEGLFPPGSWEATVDEQSKVADGGRIILGVDVSWDRATAHIGIAGLREDGLPHVGVIASRAGTDWVKPWLLADDAPPFSAVVIQGSGAPASSLIAELVAADIEVLEWSGAELGKGTGQFYDRVRSAIGEGQATSSLRHRSQPLLDIAAATAATKPTGDSWLIDRKKSAADAAPLVAVIAAMWGLDQYKAPAVSAYESRGVLTI